MATISSIGIGTSGLDVAGIISQLVALEKQPLKTLQSKATLTQAKISAFATIQSSFSSLGEMANRLSSASVWSARVASSSNTSAATVTATEAAGATSFTLDVDALAKAQSVSSSSQALGSLVGAGTLTFRVGTWSDAAANVASTAAAASTAATNATNALNAFTSGSAEAAAYQAARVANTPTVTDQQAEDDAYAALSPADLTALSTSNSAAAASTAAAAAAAAAVVAANAGLPSFTAGSGSDVSVTVTAQDTMTTLAAKINAANTGVVATVFKDGTGERLLFRSKATGLESGFRVQATDADGNNTDNAGLSKLAFDPQAGAFGMASNGIPVQYGQNAQVRINGLPVTSASNTLTDNFPGVTITLTATTTTGYGTPGEVKSPATIAVREDVTPAVKNVQDFITAYNTLATSLAEMTKYDAATKTPGIFQGDAAVLGLQSIMRGMVGSISSGSVYKRLSDVGIERQLDGTLTMNTAKLSAAANNGTELQKLFTANNNDSQSNGFALKFNALSKGVLAAGGSVKNKSEALQKELARNATEQTKVNDHADLVEQRLNKRYTALDTQMASLTALNNYVAQQITLWNKSTG
ncbi:flagellar filament capping protein FliD [Rhodoferax saidenbachensis]|uniref:Flagellar hook-associated protein 2 n=1 Tax=Rhodoferax saidenbachensis TaxID=1484693 RepID=A0A1P8K6E8_9BURK|nr:flagellar filament capping protein FliD [Rhodoferax saidenbachensis]APW41588.1 hypothetical protein RS694_02810 [Rhodoferax saidenbachensis]